jgi:hypothetical protein
LQVINLCVFFFFLILSNRYPNTVLDRDGNVALEVPAAGANRQRVVAADDGPGLRRHIPDTEIAAVQLKGGRGRLAGGQGADLGEAAQLAHGLVGGGREAGVQLDDLGAGDGARVADLGRDGGHDVPQVLAAADGERAGGGARGQVGRRERDAGVREGRVRQAVAKGVARLGALLVKVLVVDEVALGEVELQVGLGHECALVVVGLVLGNRVHQAARRVDGAKQHVVDGVARLLAERAAVQHARHVLVLDPGVHQAGSDGVDHDDGVVAVVSDGGHQAGTELVFAVLNLLGIGMGVLRILGAVAQLGSVTSLSTPGVQEHQAGI